MENLNNSNNSEAATFLEGLNGLTHAEASQKISEKMNEVIGENGESGLTDSEWGDVLREGYKQTNPHSDETFEYRQVKDSE